MIFTTEFIFCFIILLLFLLLMLPVYVIRLFKKAREKSSKDSEYEPMMGSERYILYKVFICFLSIVVIFLGVYPFRFTKSVDVNDAKSNFTHYENALYAKAQKNNLFFKKKPNDSDFKASDYMPIFNLSSHSDVDYQQTYFASYGDYQISVVFSLEKKEYFYVSVTGFSDKNEVYSVISQTKLIELINDFSSSAIKSEDITLLFSDDYYIEDYALNKKLHKNILYIYDIGLADEVYIMFGENSDGTLALYITGITEASMFF